MQSTTSKLCTILDVNMVAGACLLGILAGIFGERHVREMNQRLRLIDDNLTIYLGDLRLVDRRGQRLAVFATYYVLMVALLGADIYGWYSVALKKERLNVGVAYVPKLTSYLPFWFLYIYMAVLQVQFAQTALGLGKRYGWLNLVMEDLFLGEKSYGLRQPNQRTPQPAATAAYNFHSRSLKHRKALRDHETINRMAFIHESLGKSVRSMSSAYDLTVLILLSSCLLHLVVTAYFFVLELLGECLTGFWRQLMADDSFFSACGICRIDRELLTSFIGGITTYLVILLQFELADRLDASNAANGRKQTISWLPKKS